jgi:hypothetical protein
MKSLGAMCGAQTISDEDGESAANKKVDGDSPSALRGDIARSKGARCGNVSARGRQRAALRAHALRPLPAGHAYSADPVRPELHVSIRAWIRVLLHQPLRPRRFHRGGRVRRRALRRVPRNALMKSRPSRHPRSLVRNPLLGMISLSQMGDWWPHPILLLSPNRVPCNFFSNVSVIPFPWPC